MQKWEYTVFYTETTNMGPKGRGPKAMSRLWNDNVPDTTKPSSLDKMRDLGKEGWEIANITPLCITGTEGETSHLMLTFKRPTD